jgi:hypothetical protein
LMTGRIREIIRSDEKRARASDLVCRCHSSKYVVEQ